MLKYSSGGGSFIFEILKPIMEFLDRYVLIG